MAYIPNPNRKVKNGKAMVSAKELADFKKQYGEDKTLRDLLNMDKGLRRRGENSTLTSSAKKADTKVKDEPSKVSAAVNQESSEASAAGPAEAPAEASAVGKPFRQKNLTDLIGLSSNIRKSTTEPTPKEDSKKASEDEKSWWTTPNANLKRGSFPSGKEIREALGSSYKKGGSVSSASKRADGIAQKGKTRGKMC